MQIVSDTLCIMFSFLMLAEVINSQRKTASEKRLKVQLGLCIAIVCVCAAKIAIDFDRLKAEAVLIFVFGVVFAIIAIRTICDLRKMKSGDDNTKESP